MRELTLGTVAGEGVGVGGNRGGAVACIVGGMWLAAERALTASSLTAAMVAEVARATAESSIQRRWRP